MVRSSKKKVLIQFRSSDFSLIFISVNVENWKERKRDTEWSIFLGWLQMDKFRFVSQYVIDEKIKVSVEYRTHGTNIWLFRQHKLESILLNPKPSPLQSNYQMTPLPVTSSIVALTLPHCFDETETDCLCQKVRIFFFFSKTRFYRFQILIFLSFYNLKWGKNSCKL